MRKFKFLLLPLVSLGVFSGCALFQQPGIESVKTYTRIYLTDYNVAWQASIEALKQFDRPIQNRQAGVIQTGWADSTSDKLFNDTYGGAETYIKSRYRFNISVAPGFYNGRSSVKVAVQKELMIQRDVLEGWKVIVSDAVHENTLLYRIGRIISNKVKLQHIEEEKVRQVIGES